MRAELLPGVSVAAAPLPIAGQFPRMDVALFAGFASSGPVHCAVAVDSPAAFTTVFGPDPALAWDTAHGRPVTAALGPAVRAFFENGGRRAQVIRLCRTAQLEALWRGSGEAAAAAAGGIATANLFLVPGVYALDRPGGTLAPALARARSLGSWSDGLALRARCARMGFALRGCTHTGNGLRFDAHPGLRLGDLVELSDDAGRHRTYLRIDRLDAGAAVGPALASFEATAPGDGLPPASGWEIVADGQFQPTRAARLTLDLAVDGEGFAERRNGIGLTPEAPSAWWQESGDDEFYRPGDAARERPALVRTDDTLPVAWLPIGLGPGFGPSAGALPQAEEPLVRDGLARFDAELFVDPRLAGTGIGNLVRLAEALQAEGAVALHGIHALLAVPPMEGSGELPSLVALPDAVHPGWEPRYDDGDSLPPGAEPSAPDHWAGHRGSCAPEGEVQIAEPAYDRFLDCGTRLLGQPLLLLPESVVAPGPLTLRWTGSEPGATYLVEESALHDMAGAVERGRTEELELRVDLPREGDYYFRLTALRDGESSLPSLGLVRVRASRYQVAERDDFGGRIQVYRALLRLAAAEGGLFALLSLPRTADAAAAGAAARTLTAERGLAAPDGFSAGERHALSHGALLHGWVEQAGVSSRPRVAPPLSAVPPCGVIAGVMARRALEGGAWLSPAGQPIRGVVALADPLRDAVAIELVADRTMPLREVPRGFALTQAHTLADEDDWRPIGTRRLFTLLRRYLLQRGAAWAFEPNDSILQRTIERGLSEALLTLFRAGAFAGARPSEGFRVTVDPREADRAAGRIVAEVAVAPSHPLAFLNVVLRQLGERLTFEESL